MCVKYIVYYLTLGYVFISVSYELNMNLSTYYFTHCDLNLLQFFCFADKIFIVIPNCQIKIENTFFFKSTLKLPTFLIEYSFFRKWLFLMTTNFIIFHVFFILVYVNLIISKPSLIKLTVHGFSVMFTMFLS